MRHILILMSACLVFLAAKNAMNVAANNADTADGEGAQSGGIFNFGSVNSKILGYLK